MPLHPEEQRSFQNFYAHYTTELNSYFANILSEEDIRSFEKVLQSSKDQAAALEILAKKDPEKLYHYVKRLEMQSDFLNLSAELADSDLMPASTLWDKILTQLIDGAPKEDPTIIPNKIISFFKDNPIQRIGTEHPTEPYQFMRLIVRKTLAGLADAYRHYPSHQDAQTLRTEVHTVLKAAHKETEEILLQHPDNTNVRQMCDQILSNKLFDPHNANYQTFEKLHKHYQEVERELIGLMKNLDVSGAQKRTPHSENIRNNDFLSQDIRSTLALRRLLHQKLEEKAPISYKQYDYQLDQIELLKDGTWDGDADGKPLVTGATMHQSAIGQITHRLRDASLLIKDGLLTLLSNEIKRLRTSEPEKAKEYALLKNDLEETVLKEMGNHIRSARINPYQDFRSSIIETIAALGKQYEGTLQSSPALRSAFGEMQFIAHNYLRCRIFSRQNAAVDFANMAVIFADKTVQEQLKSYLPENPAVQKLASQPLSNLSEKEQIDLANDLILLLVNNKEAREQLVKLIEALAKDTKNASLKDELERNQILARGTYQEKNGTQHNVYETMIADTEHASNALWRLFFLSLYDGYGKVDIIRLRESVPAFERNVRNCHNPAVHHADDPYEITRPLYDEKGAYRGHLTLRGNKETDMVAESDTPKNYGDTSRAKIAEAVQKAIQFAREHGISLNIKDGRGDNNAFRSGGLDNILFYTVQARAKLNSAREEAFLQEIGNICTSILAKEPTLPFQKTLDKDAKFFVGLATDAYQFGRNNEEGLGKRRERWLGIASCFEEAKAINMSARRERNEAAKPPVAEHRYKDFLGTPKEFPVVKQENTRAISDDYGNKSSGSFANLTDASLMYAARKFIKEHGDQGEARLINLIRTNKQIAHSFILAAYGYAYMNYDIQWALFPEHERPKDEKERKAWAENARKFPLVKGATATIHEAAELVALRQEEAARDKGELFSLLIKAFPGKAKEAFGHDIEARVKKGDFVPGRKDFLFLFPQNSQDQILAQVKEFETVSQLQIAIHQMRLKGISLDKVFPKEWVDMNAIAQGKKDQLTEFLDRMQIACDNLFEAPASSRGKEMLGIKREETAIGSSFAKNSPKPHEKVREQGNYLLVNMR